MIVLVIAAVSILGGYLLGSASADVSSALMTVSAALAVSAVMVGASYFSPTLGTLASATPLGALLVVAKEQLVAPQFTDELSTVPALIGAVFWILVIFAFAARRARRQVA